ncbi:dTDP-4-dehydrorhamnose reductase [Nakamurella flavida]|uniref:dTDP-4-dehydrorhamnose reductase n=1 Tax=Nakamurella flavida TaxID=363630 RepID=UPI00277FD6F5|nr:dTDP-4-dehydrorhamnose reductase [Nakamurella flavida]MDP9777670.1 dTDP-4-dehydrorhamnose reductase [Nakamurella flavida]
MSVPAPSSPSAGSAPVSLLVTGARGQLGSDLVLQASGAGLAVVAFGSADLDITDAAAVDAALGAFADGLPAGGRGVVVNAAAYTAVDNAEDDSERAYRVNETGSANLARSAAARGLGLVHVSTDYVFPGDATTPYEVDAPTGPRSVYGASKLAGEKAVLAAHPDAHVVRTAWVYGAAGNNFVKTMARLEAARPNISVVDDQVGSPTYSADLAAGLLELATRPAGTVPGGVLHLTGGGHTTWCGFARAVFAELGADPTRVGAIASADYPQKAHRPAYSVLSPAAWTAAGLTPLRPWDAALSVALAEHPAAFRPA